MSTGKTRSYIHRMLVKSDLCEICEAAKAVTTCHRCSRRVCPYCYDYQKEMCAACAESLCDVCEKALSIDSCVLCGKAVCRACSIEIDYARRVCVTCAESYRDPRTEFEERTRSILLRIAKAWIEAFR